MRTPQNQVLHFINTNVSTELEIFTNDLKPKTAKTLIYQQLHTAWGLFTQHLYQNDFN